jgi:hypothetical protein
MILMASNQLLYNFHDAALTDFTVGPRSEVMLILGLDDPKHPPHYSVSVRFGGILNFPEVTDYLTRIPPAASGDAYRTRVDNLTSVRYEHPRYRQPHMVYRLELDALGSVLIRCSNFTVGARA